MNKIEFKDLPDTTTPLSASLFNEMQDNIEKTLNTYSTTETVIGKWIDEKPLYRKVVNFGALPNTTTKSVSTGYGATDIVVRNLYGTGVYSNGIAIPLPNTSDVAGEIVKMVLANGNINITTSNDRSSANAYIILEYTKATDV